MWDGVTLSQPHILSRGKMRPEIVFVSGGVLWVSSGSPPSDQIRESGESWGNAADSRSSAAP